MPAPDPANFTASMPTKATVEAFLRASWGYDLNRIFQVQAIQNTQVDGISRVVVLVEEKGTQQTQPSELAFLTLPDGKHLIANEEILPFGEHPFANYKAILEREAKGPSQGPANAPLQIVEFSDFQCPHCKEAQPTIEKLLASEPNAHFVFQSFPLPSHNWAAKGAAYADCVGRASNDAFWKFVQKTYDVQQDITESNADEKLTAIANDSGVKGSDIAACAAKGETSARVEHSIALGKSVDVTGTPTVFVNGYKIRSLGMPPETLKQLVDFEAKQR